MSHTQFSLGIKPKLTLIILIMKDRNTIAPVQVLIIRFK